eukprot:Nitzschia sp. Nitz4//scaffold38_size140716//123029//125560//NITZ4_003171-RA/size140716-processed-gene-0.68-mRNA-1//-1//CDS//3329550150//727//frame0
MVVHRGAILHTCASISLYPTTLDRVDLAMIRMEIGGRLIPVSSPEAWRPVAAPHFFTTSLRWTAMSVDQGWLQELEISSQTLTAIRGNSTSSWDPESDCVQLSLPCCPQATCVFQPVPGPIPKNSVNIHPLLFSFLRQLQAESPSKKTEVDNLDLVEPVKHPSYPVSVYPLPLGPQPPMVPSDDFHHDDWKLHLSSITNLPSSSTICLNCLFWDEDLDSQINTNDAIVKLDLQMALLGRLVSNNGIILLRTSCGLVIATVSVTCESSLGQDFHDVYRVGFNVSDWKLEVAVPDMQETKTNTLSEPSGPAFDESSIPGYEALREDIFRLIQMHGHPASPSGILLTGCPGVGKSRLAKCIVHDLGASITSTNNMSSDLVAYTSVQDLIFQAATESDLLRNAILPNLLGKSLWVLDDLHFLERDASDDAIQNDSEYSIVVAVLVEAIQRMSDTIAILGIGQVFARLPPELTKSGTLEKHIEMIPPGQVQRTQMWEHFLLQEAMAEETCIRWSSSLADATSGCVAMDLVRIYNNAKVHMAARPEPSIGKSFLDWEDLQLAARAAVPSQLAELDVCKPIFDPSLSLDQLHVTSWSCLGGYETLKKDVYRQVVIPWKSILSSNSINGTSWLDPPSGVLFCGPSGCGKTEAAKCLGNSLGLPMIQVKASDILDKWLGGSEAILRSLFARARAASPCILFLDEIDSIANNREEDDSAELSSRILSTLLNEMDGVSTHGKYRKVLVVACTNRMHSLDKALLRPGRLQEHFLMEKPSLVDLTDILHLNLKHTPLGSDVNLRSIASILLQRGATGADVEGICREACFLAFNRADNPDTLELSVADLETASRSIR